MGTSMIDKGYAIYKRPQLTAPVDATKLKYSIPKKKTILAGQGAPKKSLRSHVQEIMSTGKSLGSASRVTVRPEKVGDRARGLMVRGRFF